MRLSNLVRFVEDKSIAAATAVGSAASTLGADIKTEYNRRREQRVIEQAEIMARAQMIVAEKFAVQQAETMLHMMSVLDEVEKKLNAADEHA